MGIVTWPLVSFILFFNLFLHANFFYRNLFDLQHISRESFELSEYTLELRDQVYGSNFLAIWDNMLEAAKDKIVPMKELLAIYCDGQLNRTCYICSAEIHVSSFYPFYVVSSDMYDQRGVNADEFRISQLFTRDLPCIIANQDFVQLGPSPKVNTLDSPSRTQPTYFL